MVRRRRRRRASEQYISHENLPSDREGLDFDQDSNTKYLSKLYGSILSSRTDKVVGAGARVGRHLLGREEPVQGKVCRPAKQEIELPMGFIHVQMHSPNLCANGVKKVIGLEGN